MVEGRQCRGGCDAISGSDAFDIFLAEVHQINVIDCTFYNRS
jgi:hypothetical protein